MPKMVQTVFSRSPHKTVHLTLFRCESQNEPRTFISCKNPKQNIQYWKSCCCFGFIYNGFDLIPPCHCDILYSGFRWDSSRAVDLAFSFFSIFRETRNMLFENVNVDFLLLSCHIPNSMKYSWFYLDTLPKCIYPSLC